MISSHKTMKSSQIPENRDDIADVITLFRNNGQKTGVSTSFAIIFESNYRFKRSETLKKRQKPLVIA